jgi:hypothetical protein
MSPVDQATHKNAGPRGDDQSTSESKGEFDPRPAKVRFPSHQHCRKQVKDAGPGNGFSYGEAPDLWIFPHIGLSGCVKVGDCSPE